MKGRGAQEAIRENFTASCVLRDAAEFKLDALEFKFGGPEFLTRCGVVFSKCGGVFLRCCVGGFSSYGCLGRNSLRWFFLL